MMHTIIEYELEPSRSLAYAKAIAPQDFEVLYAGAEAPDESRYTWEHVPQFQFSMGPFVLRTFLALRTALAFSQSEVWSVVKPDFWQLLGLCQIARGKPVRIEAWLDETQHAVWFGVTVLRAAGFKLDTRHLALGLAECVAAGSHAGHSYSKGEAA